MAEVTIGEREVPTDVRTWDPDLRQTASMIVGAVAGVFLLAALVYYVLNAAGSGWFLWVAIVVLALLLVVELAVVATGIAREEEVGPAWLAGPAAQQTQAPPAADTTTSAELGGPEPAEPVTEHPEIDLQCPECEQMFAVEDTGERPLATQCPHCRAQGHVNLPEREEPPAERETSAPAAGASEDPFADEEDPLAGLGEEEEPPAEDVETISLSCPACETEFETEDTGERPLKTTCPGCGKSGKLS